MRNNEAGVDFILIKELLGGILYLIHKTIYYVMNETFCKKERGQKMWFAFLFATGQRDLE